MDNALLIPLVASIVAIISAIISPIVTSLINNRHSLKMIELNYFRNVKIKAIESYITATSDYIYDRSDSNWAKYTKSYSVATLYLDEALTKHIVSFDESIKSNQSLNLLRAQLVFLSQKLNLTLQGKGHNFE